MNAAWIRFIGGEEMNRISTYDTYGIILILVITDAKSKIQKMNYICIVMSDQEIYNKIKSTVHSFLPDAQVLLFGSRVNGPVHKDSDYDLLIILDKAIPLKEKMKFQSKIRKALVWALDAPFDVLLKDKDDIERFKNAKGHIIYYALKESVAI